MKNALNSSYQIKYELSSNFSQQLQNNPEVVNDQEKGFTPEQKEKYRKIMDSMEQESLTSIFSTLKFDQNNSEYKPEIQIPDIDNLLNFNQIYASSEGETYTDRKLNKIITISNNMGKDEISESTFDTLEWKLLEGQETILEHPCLLAETTNSDNQKVRAWYTKEINGSYGPSIYCGLEGVILELSINDGLHLYQAVQIQAFANLKIVPSEISEKYFH